jgi:hypothetical protein
MGRIVVGGGIPVGSKQMPIRRKHQSQGANQARTCEFGGALITKEAEVLAWGTA